MEGTAARCKDSTHGIGGFQEFLAARYKEEAKKVCQNEEFGYTVMESNEEGGLKTFSSSSPSLHI